MKLTEKRKKQAMAAIKKALGTEEGEESVDLFISHHLEELPPSYWKKRCGTSSPKPKAVLALLKFHSSWGEGDVENFDFSLPGDVSDYVISVHFDEEGAIDEISMES